MGDYDTATYPIVSASALARALAPLHPLGLEDVTALLYDVTDVALWPWATGKSLTHRALTSRLCGHTLVVSAEELDAARAAGALAGEGGDRG